MEICTEHILSLQGFSVCDGVAGPGQLHQGLSKNFPRTASADAEWGGSLLPAPAALTARLAERGASQSSQKYKCSISGRGRTTERVRQEPAGG